MEELREILLSKGASLVGFANIKGLYNRDVLEGENSDIYEYPYGISIAVKVPQEVIRGIKKQPTIEYYNAYLNLNDKLDQLAIYCEEYLISKGYKSYAQTVNRTKEYGVYTTVMPHKTVAVSSGIGWIGKSALLVTPEYGSAVRLTSVLTNAPLEVNEKLFDSPCKKCNICTEACPAKAIVGNVWEKSKGRDYIFNAIKCRTTARKIARNAIDREITLCGKCIEVCPFTQRYLKSEY